MTQYPARGVRLTSELAKLLGYARRSLINMARDGKIPPAVVYQKKKYGSWKVNLEEWDKWELTR